MTLRTSLVGRDAELRQLLQISAQLQEQTQTVPEIGVLLGGDAGVGKTRLTQEWLERLTAQGWRAVVGHCVDFGEAPLPYLPFTEILRALARQDDQWSQRASHTHPALAQLLTRSRSGEDTFESLDRAEVFEAMQALLDERAADAPLLVVIEDVHWADASTRDLITFLLRRGFAHPVLIAITYRTDDLHRKHPLRSTLASWVRFPAVERVHVGRLAPPAVRAMIHGLTGGADAHASAVPGIVERADGNAFYVEELVGALLNDQQDLPEDLAELLLIRLDRLDDRARQLVQVMAVGGNRVPHALLAAVLGWSGRELDAALRESVEAHILEPSGSSHYAFRHALLGEAVYDDLLPSERTRLHTAYASAVRDLPEGDLSSGIARSAALAKHAYACHDLGTALTASFDAGTEALALGSPEVAIKHLTQALGIYDAAAAQLDDPPDVSRLVARTAEALTLGGQPDVALELACDQLAQLAPDADPVTRARLHLAVAEAACVTESLEDDPRLHTRTGLELLGEGSSPLRARLLSCHAAHAFGEWDHDEADEYAQAALKMADELELPRLSADAALTLARLQERGSRSSQSRAAFQEVLANAVATSDAFAQRRAAFALAEWDYETGDLPQAIESYLTTYRSSAQAGQPWSPYAVDSRQRAAVLSYMIGQWDQAQELANHSAEDAPPVSRTMLDCTALLVAAGRGETDRLDLIATIRERWHRDGVMIITAAGPWIELAGLRDGWRAALDAYDEAVDQMTKLWFPQFGARIRLTALALGLLNHLAADIPSDDHDEVLRAARSMVAGTDVVFEFRELNDQSFLVEGQAWTARMHAELNHLGWQLGQSVQAADLVEQWQTTIALFDQLGHRFEKARSQIRLDALLRALGRPDPDVRRAAEAVLSQLGAQVWSPAPSAAVEDPSMGAALTPRELEILKLVDQGRSNGEIGKRLFISTKTVSVHVSNLMAKLGARSRTEAASIGRREGLV